MAFVCVPKPKVIEDEMVTADDDIRSIASSSSIEILEGSSSSSCSSSSSSCSSTSSSSASSGTTTPVRTVTPTAPPSFFSSSARAKRIYADAFRGDIYEETPAPSPNFISDRDNAGRYLGESVNSLIQPIRPPPEDHFAIITPDGMFVVPRVAPVRKGLWHCTKQVTLLSWRLVAAATEKCLVKVEQTIDRIVDLPPSSDNSAVARKLSPEQIFLGGNILLLVTVTVGFLTYRSFVLFAK